jgi:hypothetical protein
MGQDLKYTEEDIAYVAHEANRAMQSLHGDDVPSLPWVWEGRALRNTAIAGVRRVLDGISPEENHEQWCIDKLKQGWSYGPVKDIDAKTHPCIVHWEKLPQEERAKVRVFFAIVKTLMEDML